MSDQNERIVLEIDDAPATAGAKRANAALDSIEKKAESTQLKILSITDRNLNAQERIVAQAEKKAALFGKSAAERAESEKKLLIARVAGNEQAATRIEAAYAKMASQSKALELKEQIKQGIENPAGAAAGAIQGIASRIGTFGVVAGAALLAVAGAAKETFAFFSETAERAHQLVNLSDQLGITAGEAEKLSAMSKIAGTDVGGLTGFMRKLSQALADGGEEGKKGADALRTIGVSARDNQGNLKGTLVLFSDIGKAIEKIESTPEKIAALSKIGGRGAIDQLPFFKNFSENEAAASRTGVGDSGVINSLRDANDKIKILETSWEHFKTVLAGKLEPIILPVVMKLTDALGGDVGAGAQVGNFFVNPSGFIAALIAEKFGAKFGRNDSRPGGPSAPSVPGIGLLSSDAPNAQKLRDSFLAQDSAQGIKNRLEETTRKLNEAQAKLEQLPSTAGTAVVKSSISDITRLRGDEDRLKIQLKNAEALRENTIRIGEEIRDAQLKNQITVFEDQKKDITGAEALQLQALENFSAREVQDRRSIEDEKLSLQKETIDRVAALDRAALQAQSDAEIAHIRKVEKEKGLPQRLIDQKTDLIAIGTASKISQIDIAAAQNKIKLENDLGNTRILRAREYADRTKDYDIETSQFIIGNDQRTLAAQRDQQTEMLGLIQQDTVSSKLATEQARLDIEVAFLQKSEALELASLEIRRAREQERIHDDYLRAGISQEDALKQSIATEERFDQEKLRLSDDTNAAITASATRAAVQQTQLLRDQLRGVFDTVKQDIGSIFDALFDKSQNIFQAIGSVLKKEFLGAIKDIVSSKLAASLTTIFTGEKVTLATDQVGRGPLASIAARLGLGAKPQFGASKLEQSNHLGDVTLSNGAVPVVVSGIRYETKGGGSASSLQSLTRSPMAAGLALALGLGGFAGPAPSSAVGPGIVESAINGISTGPGTIFGGDSILGPGGTSGFAGPVGLGGGVAGPGGSSSLGGIGGLLGILKGGGLSSASALPLLGLGGAALGLKGAFGLGQSNSIIGKSLAPVLGAVSGLVGFGSLAALFPALVAAGPAGWIAAAGIGAAVGLIGIFHKSATSKLHDKIKDTYGVDVKDNGVLKQILGMAQGSFGGNLDMAIRSEPIRQLIELYAMSSGQNAKGIVDHAQASIFANQNGQLTAQPTYFNGSPVFPGQTNGLGGLPTLVNGSYQLSSSLTGANVAQPMTIIVQNTMPAEAVGAYMEGRMVQTITANPRTISQANVAGKSTGSARRESAAATLNPAFLTA